MVFIGKNRRLGGRRCVTEVLEVVGAPDGRVASRPIFGPSPVDGRAVRARRVRDHARSGTEELAAAGYDDTATRSSRSAAGDGSGSVWVAVLLGAGIGGALLLLIAGIRGVAVDPTRPPSRVAPGGDGAAVAGGCPVGSWAAVAVAALTLAVTRWPVAAAGMAALVVWWPALFGGTTAEQRQIAALEALVTWTESLRDTIAAHASLEQAIPASAVNAPPLIRPGAGAPGRADAGQGADGPGVAGVRGRTGRPVRGPGDRRADAVRETPRVTGSVRC